MALTNTNVPNSSSDVVGVFDSKFNQIFKTARPIKALVRETSKPMEHPVENGSIITDHRIIWPIEIELSMILPAGLYRPVYQQIKAIFLAAPLLSVQTRTSTYQNMIISEIPHQEDADMFNTVTLALKMKQVQIVSNITQSLPSSAVKNTVDQSTINIGQQQPGTDSPVPAPVINGSGSALPQVPGPPDRSTLNLPPLPAQAPYSPAQWQQLYGASNFEATP